MFYAEIQDGRQKWRENHFKKKSLVHSPDTLGVKNFDSRTASEINAFYTEIQDGGKIFVRKSPVYSADTLWVKNFSQNCFISHQDKCVFFTKIQDGRQKWQENDFQEKLPVDSAHTLWVKNFVEIALPSR